MMKLAKYKNFLSDKDLYFQNKIFWNDTIINLSKNKFEEWVITKFSNGEDFFDGNPIFSAFYPDLNKAIRIIQLPVDEDISLLRTWLDIVNHGDKSIKELVLALQPNDKAYNSAISLITLFLSGQAVGKYINSYNIFYKKQVDLKSIGIDLGKAKSSFIKPFAELNQLNAKHLQDKKLDINVLREIYRRISVQKRVIEKNLIKNSYERISYDARKEIDTIINILTIGHLVDFKNDINKDTYIDLIERKYGIDQYIYKLHTTSSHIDALSKESINSLIT